MIIELKDGTHQHKVECNYRKHVVLALCGWCFPHQGALPAHESNLG